MEKKLSAAERDTTDEMGQTRILIPSATLQQQTGQDAPPRSPPPTAALHLRGRTLNFDMGTPPPSQTDISPTIPFDADAAARANEETRMRQLEDAEIAKRKAAAEETLRKLLIDTQEASQRKLDELRRTLEMENLRLVEMVREQMAAELIQQYGTKQGGKGDEARSEETHHPQARTTDTPTPAEHQMRDEETATTSDQNQNTSTSTTTEIDMEPQCKTDQLDDLLSMELQRRLEGTWQSTAQEFQTLDIKGNIAYYGKDQAIQLKSAQGNTNAFRCELPNGTTGTAQLEQDDEIVRWENGTKCMRFVPPSTPKEDVAHMKEQLATMADFQGKWIKRDGRNDKVYIIEKTTAIINSERIPIVYKNN